MEYFDSILSEFIFFGRFHIPFDIFQERFHILQKNEKNYFSQF